MKDADPSIEWTLMGSNHVVDTEGSLWKIEDPQQVKFAQTKDTGCLYRYTGDGEIHGWAKLTRITNKT